MIHAPSANPSPGSSWMLDLPGSPLGIAWFFLYGYSGVPAAPYLPQLRSLGAGLTKVYLFWQQVEPEKGRFDWSAADAYVDQLQSPEEGLIAIFSSSLWGAKKPSALLPPSPAKNLDDYHEFIHALVRRYRGRVRYWQNDSEPNNPVYWSGSAEEFVAQLRVFARAVRAADPEAVVVAGGYDGLFVPPGLTPRPGQRATPFPRQEEGLAFFDLVLQAGADSFDCFDLRLYGDPYTIAARVDYIRGRMAVFACPKPIVCTEYGGPNFFEFPENRKYLPLLGRWSQAVGQPGEQGAPADDRAGGAQIEQLYANMDSLAPQTRMFLQGCEAALEAKYHRLQSRGIVMRNLLAFAAGVQKMIYWDLLHVPGPRDDLMNLMYGKIGLLAVENGALARPTPSAAAYRHMAQTLAGVRAVARVMVDGSPDLFVFKIDRGPRGPVHVAWERREAFAGEDAPATVCRLPWTAPGATATDAFGASVPTEVRAGQVEFLLSLTPVYLEPAILP